MSSVFGALVPAVELVPVDELAPVHFVAVGGAGMSGIAALYAELGLAVSGSDRADSPTLRRLAELGVRTHVGHGADQLADARTVVLSSAIAADNPEYVAARERGLRIWHRSAALAALMQGRDGIAIGGTHGKTTTTGMVAHILTETGRDPGYVVGAPLASTNTSFRLGTGPFVVEADESDGSFLQYPARVAVVTNIEVDHLDNWGTPEAYVAGFDDFMHRAEVVVAGAEQALSQIELQGFGSRAVLATDQGPVTVELIIPGRHNLANAAAAIAAVGAVGVAPGEAAGALASFTGTARRFTPVGTVDGVAVFDDYAHHPTELRVTLEAARVGVESAGRGGRVIACFQPHLYSRTRDFADEFGVALALADEVVLTDIFGAREDPMPGITSDLIAEPCRRAMTAEGRAGTVRLVPRGDIAGTVAALAGDGDVVLTLGAGDITAIAPDIVAALRQRQDAR